jgi:hypothetical protein
LTQAARGLKNPVLLVRGASSEVVGEAHLREFLALVPHAQYADVFGARHMVAGDRNDPFASAMLAFLARFRADQPATEAEGGGETADAARPPGAASSLRV